MEGVWRVWEDREVLVALASYPGVSGNECEAFTLVFERFAGAEIVRVGERVGAVGGPGGGGTVERVYDDVLEPDVVLVPGGLGCARAAEDPALRRWLCGVAPHCRWMAASSTGTVIVAAAGLLDDRAAATHWLAGDLLHQYGSAASPERIVEIGRVITCEGEITAMHVALLLVLRLAGPEEVARIRTELDRLGRGDEAVPRRSWWRRRKPVTSGPKRPRNPELVAPDVVEFEPLRVHPR
ncbi:MAG TPA: DJ-1/PfpI family protein [Ilumatobacteraceae bacterium]|nr:DJ-1/PfpI family protein [Ilumatobacteraceae bacterium]